MTTEELIKTLRFNPRIYDLEAADTIERLENELLAATLRIENDAAEIASLKSSNESYITLANTAYELTEQLTVERDALKQDAERYRWLRDTPWKATLTDIICQHRNKRWDSEIDAAMGKQK